MKKALERINEVKKEGLIEDYAIGGAIGALKWVETFFTRDLDIFIIVSQVTDKSLINLSPIYDYLESKGCFWEGQWIVMDGVPVDFIVGGELEKEAIENAESTEFEEVKTKVITPEYLIVLFLKAGRDKDIRKIQMLQEQTQINREKLTDILSRYSLTDKFKKLAQNPST